MNQLFGFVQSKFYSWIYESGVQEGFRTRAINFKLISRLKVYKSMGLEEKFYGPVPLTLMRRTS